MNKMAAGGNAGSIDFEDDKQEEYPDWGPIFLSAASKAILLFWYRKAQRLRASKKGKKREKVLKSISDDEGEDHTAEWTKKIGSLSASTRAIQKKALKVKRNSKGLFNKMHYFL